MNTNIQQTNMQYKEVPIIQLPENCMKRITFECWVKDANKACVTVVAIHDNLNSWIAYIGYPHIDNIKDSLRNLPSIEYHCVNLNHYQDILAYGDILDKETAEQLFPEWSYRRYRG